MLILSYGRNVYLDCFLLDTDLETLRLEKSLNGTHITFSFFLTENLY
jgi:hypothetical protein